MATPDIYSIPPMPPNAKNPSAVQSDFYYPPSAPMQSVPPPPPYAIPPTAQMSIYPQPQMIMTQMPIAYQGVIVSGNFIPPQTVHIKDYMVWSIINVFLGGFLLGIVAVLLSIQTKKRKQEGDVAGARTMSNITLAFNILTTVIFFALTAFLIVYYVLVLSAINELY